VLAVIAPISIGVMNVPPVKAQAPEKSETFELAAIRPSVVGGNPLHGQSLPSQREPSAPAMPSDHRRRFQDVQRSASVTTDASDSNTQNRDGSDRS
jgi:hypothetical protein